MKSTENFKTTIKEYLDKRGSKDPLFQRIVVKPNKNIDDCITYILNTVKNSGCNGFTDDEVYNMAIHYYDEDKIDIGSSDVSCHVIVNHSVELTEDDKKEAYNTAMKQEIKKARLKILNKNKKSESKSEPKTEINNKTTNTLF